MYNIEVLANSGKLEQLRGGLTSKGTYRLGDVVLGVVDVSRLAQQDRDPLRMRDFIENYITELKKAGVTVVEVLEVSLQGGKIVIVTRYQNVFLDNQMALGDKQFTEGVNGILSVLSLIKDSPVGIDPTPKNFAISEGGIFYADFFYPFSRSYVEWIRSRMDPENPQHQYISLVQDYVFNPLVYAHALADFNQLNLFPPNQTMGLVANHCSQCVPGFNIEDEYKRYVERKRLARAKMGDY